jgi:hypothetical protein
MCFFNFMTVHCYDFFFSIPTYRFTSQEFITVGMKYLLLLLRYDNIRKKHEKLCENALLKNNSNSIFKTFIIPIFSNSHVL